MPFSILSLITLSLWGLPIYFFLFLQILLVTTIAMSAVSCFHDIPNRRALLSAKTRSLSRNREGRTCVGATRVCSETTPECVCPLVPRKKAKHEGANVPGIFSIIAPCINIILKVQINYFFKGIGFFNYFFNFVSHYEQACHRRQFFSSTSHLFLKTKIIDIQFENICKRNTRHILIV